MLIFFKSIFHYIYNSLKAEFKFFGYSNKKFNSNFQNTVICTCLNDSFVDYYIVLFKSIKEHNSWFNFKWIIYYNHKYSPLSIKSQSILVSINKNIEFKIIDEKPYGNLFERVPLNLRPSLFKLEIFRLGNLFKKIIYLDADMLCLGSIKELFENDNYLAGCLAGKNYNHKILNHSKFKRKAILNAGVLVLNNKSSNENIFNKLLKTKGYFKNADQDIINIHFNFIFKYIFNHKFNYHAFFFQNYIKNDDIRFLHYAGPKPRENIDLDYSSYWINYYNKYRLNNY